MLTEIVSECVATMLIMEGMTVVFILHTHFIGHCANK